MISIGFIITSLVVVLIPGTGVIYTVTASLSGNRRTAILAALGCTLGILPHLLAAVFGISAILHAGRTGSAGNKGSSGCCTFCTLAYGLLRTRGGIDIREGLKENGLKVIGKAILLNLLNPKLTLFFLSFLPPVYKSGRYGPAAADDWAESCSLWP